MLTQEGQNVNCLKKQREALRSYVPFKGPKKQLSVLGLGFRV